MFEIKSLLVVIPAMPLAAAILCGLLGKHVFRQRSHIPVIVSLVVSLLASLQLVRLVHREATAHHGAPGAAHSTTIGWEKVYTLWRWADVERALPHPAMEQAAKPTAARESAPPSYPLRIAVTLRADPLTAIMLATVTLVALLVAIYSTGYMHGDPGYWRYYAYLGLFVFSMTMLVSVSNFLLLYVFWEAVGLCSYLLIGFWFQKPSAAQAGKKAFLVNRVGDFGFALGIFLIWITYGTLDFHDPVATSHLPAGVLGQARLAAPAMYAGGATATAICLLLLLGACGKSAQFPLHVWLPDAMEGPTPVSALIHAATMVTAGVYMVARCAPLFAASPMAQEVVATIGAGTALMAAFIALTQTDLKRILAYSTISQLGYMFLGLGAGTLLGATAGMFHLFTHAFFKALLFLGAGSVMHAMGGVIDVRQFGGLRRRMPATHLTFLIGSCALAGLFPLAGFWSKDMILLAVQQQAGKVGYYQWLYYAGFATALLTAFYTFRAYFLAFFGPERIPPEAGHHAHESPSSMTVPLWILSIFAILVGAYFEYTHGFAHFLGRAPSLEYLARRETTGDAHGGALSIMIASAAVALVGLGLAAWLYLGPRGPVEAIVRAGRATGLYQLSRGKLYFDQIYQFLIVWPLRGLAWLLAWGDRWIVDGLVNVVGKIPLWIAWVLRPLQSGVVPFYALAMLLGLLVLLGTLLM